MCIHIVNCTDIDNSPQDLYTMCCNLDFFPSFAQKYLISCLCDCTIVTRPESFLQFSTQIVRNQKLNKMIYFIVSKCTELFHSIQLFELKFVCTLNWKSSLSIWIVKLSNHINHKLRAQKTKLKMFNSNFADFVTIT